MTERRRAQAGQYAQRVNRALAVQRRFPVPAVRWALVQRYQISVVAGRQSRRRALQASGSVRAVP